MSTTVKHQLDQAFLLLNNGQIDKSKEILELILKNSHRNIDALQLLGIAYASDGNFSQAIDTFSRAIKLNPTNHQLLFNRANAYCENKQYTLALADVEKSLLINNFDYDALTLHGFCSTICGRYDKAITSYNTILKLYPNDLKALISKGHLLIDTLKHSEAFSIFHSILVNHPHSFETYFEYGNALLKLYNFEEACLFYEKAISIDPNHADAYSNRCNALRKIHRIHEALDSINKSIAINPNSANYHNNKGNVLLDCGELNLASESFEKAIEINPSYLDAYSNLLFTINYSQNKDAKQTLEIAKKYGELVASAATKKFTTWTCDPNPSKLRLGFISGDLRNHPVGFFIEGLIEKLDSSRFDLFAFVTSPLHDDLSDRVMPFFNKWISLQGLSDVASANLIHEQGIHILIDLSGHTSHHRLPVLAFKPAPIQVSYLGYFATTGVCEIDYFLSDPFMAPEGEEHNFTEKLLNFSSTWLCLKPPGHSVAIKTAPVVENDYITFGCFGNLTKMNDVVINVWAQIMLMIPDAKLLLKSNQLADPQIIASVMDKLARNGVTPDRLLLEGPSPKSEYFDTYNRIDMVLDTFPYPGGTTTMDALWMGCPVLTLKGHRFLSRLGESILINAGETDWIANDQSEYISKAITFAKENKKYPMNREMRRAKVLGTDLFNTSKFALNFAETMLSIWKVYKAES